MIRVTTQFTYLWGKCTNILPTFQLLTRELGKIAEALDYFRRSLRASVVSDSIVRKLYASIADCEQQLRRPGEALRVCREGRTHYPEDAELLLRESMILEAQGELLGAIHCVERLLAGRDGDHFASVSTGLRGLPMQHRLARLFLRAGRLDDADAQCQQIFAQQPRYVPALYTMADVCLARRDGAGLEATIEHLRELPGTAVEIEVLRARLALARGNYALARQMAEAIIAREPRALSARVALCDILLQEGRDWFAAERALRAVLEIDPHHAVCRKNLETLLRQQDRKGA